MYLTRMENSGGFQDKESVPKHHAVPNMKLVMNPEGKVTDWDDLAPDQRPDYSQVAAHAAPGAPSLHLPEVADPVAESLNAGAGKGGELFVKRKKKAESWIVDDNSIGRGQPSAFADHFIQEQTQQQLAFQQEKLVEQQQKKQLVQQEAAVREAQQQLDFPQDFQHTSLKARSFTPSLDLSCHNVQGINVWANTAPRGWSNTYTRSKATPTRGSAAPPSADMREQQELQAQAEEQQRREMEAKRLEAETREQQRLEAEEERLRLQMQAEEEERMRREMEEQLRIQQEEEQRKLQLQAEEQQRREEEARRMEAERFEQQKREEEARRMEAERFEQQRLQEEYQESLRRQEEQMIFERQQQELMQQQQKKASKTQGFSYGVKQQDISHIGPKDAQLAMPPMSSSSSVFESSQSQQFSSVQQSSSSFSQTQSTNQIYESQ